jgi:hypothetical protein
MARVAGVHQPFVHLAALTLGGDRDAAAPGGAVTTALCGHWEHEGACRWPHLTTTGSRGAGAIMVRTIFAAQAQDEDVVRRMIATALRSGALDGPSGHSTWTLESEGPGAVEDADQEWAARQRSRGDGD